MPNWYSDWQRRPTGNGRPRDPAVGEKILGAALELLAERGFRGTTVRAVAARAGVGAAAIYRRHENREEMMLAAIDESVGVREVENTGNTELDLVSMLTVVRESVYAGPGHPGFGGGAVGVRRTPGATGDIPSPGSLAKAEVDQVGPGAGDTPGRDQDDVDLDAAVDMLWGSTFARFVTGSNSPVGTVGAVVKTVLDGLKRSERAPKFELTFDSDR